MKSLALLIATTTLLAGCETIVTPLSTGGSRADGTVEFSYQYGVLSRPVVDWDSADMMAAERCEGWGYTGADRFDGTDQECISRNASGSCMASRVTATYQCTSPNL